MSHVRRSGSTPASPRAAYIDGLKWIIGLSTAAIAGVFLHLQELGRLPQCPRIVVAVAVGLFFISIFSGVNYLVWLTTVDVDKERNKEIDMELTDTLWVSLRKTCSRRRRKSV